MAELYKIQMDPNASGASPCAVPILHRSALAAPQILAGLTCEVKSTLIPDMEKANATAVV